MKAIIMAGGEGSRLRPLTYELPKPLVPVLNRPIMEYIIELLKKHGIYEIGVTLQYQSQKIKNWFGDGRDFGVKLTYFLEEYPLGTAGSIKNAENFLDETFLVISGDALTDFDISKITDFHYQKKSKTTIVLKTVENPLEYGVVLKNEQEEIYRFLEKPSWGEVFSDQVNTGIYVLEPEILQLIPKDATFDFSRDLFPKLLKDDQKIFGFVAEGYWCDIGSIEQYKTAHFDVLAGRVRLKLKAKEIRENIWVEDKVEIMPSAQLVSPCYLGENTKIGEGVNLENCIIGSNSTILRDGKVTNSIIWNSVFLDKAARIESSVLMDNCILHPNTTLKEHTVVGSKVNIGQNVIVEEGKKIWPNKTIEAGTILRENLIYGEEERKSKFGREGISGLANFEITTDFALKLAEAFGSTLALGTSVTIASDGQNMSKVIKNIMTAGLLSTGVNIRDLGEITVPIHREYLQNLQESYGVHIKYNANNAQKIHIQFLDEAGIDFDREKERKIENLLVRGDYRKVTEKDLGRIENVVNLSEKYRENLLSIFDVAKIRAKDFKIVINRNKLCSKLYIALVKEFNIHAYLVDSIKNKNSFQYFGQNIDKLQEVMTKQAADFAVLIDNNGEKIIIVDKAGNLVKKEQLYLLMTKVILNTFPRASIVASIERPENIAKFVDSEKGAIHWTKKSTYDFLRNTNQVQIKESQGKYQQIRFEKDGLYTLLILLEYMANNEISLENLLKQIPTFSSHYRTAHCPFNAKGYVMRRIISTNRANPENLIDGIKIARDEGIIKIIPSIDKPEYEIYGEASNYELAHELTDFYAQEIKNILEEL